MWALYGLADLRCKTAYERAELLIENCAHPSYRPQLLSYFEEACAATHGAQTPQLLSKCFSFHENLREHGTMRF